MDLPLPLQVENPNRKFLIYISINLILMFIIFALIYLIHKTTKELDMLKGEILRLSAASNQLNQLKNEFGSVQEALTALNKILPTSDELIFVSEELERYAKNFNLGFNFQYGSLEEGPPKAKYFTLYLEGSLEDITKFLEGMNKNFPWIVEILNIDIRGLSSEGYSIVLSGKIFIR